ncbi:putative mitochondrial protein [Dendrobium catenatum]|uniref:Putative mitochondrial protein n=1 Tax=Dendrobium catenatum TaxID=906689 RepID=A0A2I0WWK9_9ASPA|nr:putative mitochondrial protein [Dendrobium catenatum]
MDDFNDMIMNCNLIDIGFAGNKFTWNRGHLWQRLDRVLFNNAWINVFNSTKVVHLSRTLSDHSPLLINVNFNLVGFNSRFRFQNMWLSHDSFINVVQNNWSAPIFPDDSITGMTMLGAKLKWLKMVLNWWNKNVFKNIFSNIKEMEEKISALEDYCQNDPTVSNFTVLSEAKLALSKLQGQEETYWKQKAAIKHLVEGDNNTSYFHALVNKKRAINGIVYAVILDFFKGNPIPKFFSSTSIALIPKSNNVNSWNDFRPISLCTVFYKLISKVLVNRLSVLLPKLVSPNQMGFIKGRTIVDNILIAQEFCQDLDIKTRGGNMILKLDIAKAYDNINWSFIYNMLRFFGFDDRFISLSSSCIESPFFSIILNGKCHGSFKSSHGLRQGDPISPAIFILAVDYLSRGIADLLCKSPSLYFRTLGGINISHLCFTDDFIIFMNASKNKVSKVLSFLIILKLLVA